MQQLTKEKLKQILAARLEAEGDWEHASDSALQLGVLLVILEEQKWQTRLLEDIRLNTERIRLRI